MTKNIELIDAIEHALKMTLVRVKTFPDYGVYIHALDQLTHMLTGIKSGVSFSKEEKDAVDIGLMAVKELDVSDPEYSDSLCKADYLFKNS